LVSMVISLETLLTGSFAGLSSRILFFVKAFPVEARFL
jgi:hypothetical protein